MKFEYTPLSFFADIKGGKRLPKGKFLTNIINEHPYIRVQNLGNKKNLELTSEYEYVDNETQKLISKYTVATGNVLISIVGTVGLIAIVGKTLDGANLTENCAKIMNFKGLDRDFLYYYLISHEGQNAIQAATVGAVQPKLPLKNIQKLPIPRISLKKQQKIGKLLSSLDDKIELNAQINHNLEEQAKAIFKSWFVDFEPFQNGKFVDSEWGQIPAGWKVGTFGEIASVSSGKRPVKKSDLKSEECTIPLIGAACIMGFTCNYLYNTPIVVTGRVGTHGVIQYFNEKCWPSDNTLVIQSKYLNFVYLYLQTVNFISLNRGSTQPLITQSDIKKLPCLIIPENTILNFEENLRPIRALIQNNLHKSQKLALLQDLLLPKLMSGEIDVSQVDV